MNQIVIKDWPLTIVENAAEPLIEDEVLGRKLGFTRPRKVRDLIGRLVASGQIDAPRRGVARRPGNGGHEYTPFLLTRTQALHVIAKSETPTAAAITAEMIEVYMAWLDGRRTPSAADITPVLARLVEGYETLLKFSVETRRILTDLMQQVGYDPDDEKGRSGTLREFPVDRKSMQTLIMRTAKGLGWTFGAVQARLASKLGEKSYLYMPITRVPEARRILSDLMFETSQQAAEKSEAEQVRDQQRKVYEVAMSDKKTLN